MRFSGALSLCLVVGALIAFSAEGALFTGLYEASVPIEDPSQEGGFRDALVRVLVRVTGRADVADDPSLSELLGQPRRLLQQYRYTDDGALWVRFDGEAVQRALITAGQPVWGRERPATLLWLAVDAGGGTRGLLGADDPGELREFLESVADDRGIPLVLPLLDSEDFANLSFADVWGGFDDKILEASRRYNVDAVLVGRATGIGGSPVGVRWRLLMDRVTENWQGDLAAGINSAADAFARRYAFVGHDLGSDEVPLTVSGIDTLRAYGTVSRYLEGLTQVRTVAVDQVLGDTIVFRLALRGDIATLQRAIGLGDVLAAATASPDGVREFPLGLRYQYQP